MCLLLAQKTSRDEMILCINSSWRAYWELLKAFNGSSNAWVKPEPDTSLDYCTILASSVLFLSSLVWTFVLKTFQRCHHSSVYVCLVLAFLPTAISWWMEGVRSRKSGRRLQEDAAALDSFTRTCLKKHFHDPFGAGETLATAKNKTRFWAERQLLGELFVCLWVAHQRSQ